MAAVFYGMGDTHRYSPPLEGRGVWPLRFHDKKALLLPSLAGAGGGKKTINPPYPRYNLKLKTMRYNSAKANDAEQKELRKSLRSNMTPAEAMLWRALRGRGAGGLKFRRQQGIGPYVLDFYCPERRLCVELDGSSHDYRYDYDEQRTKFLASQGIRVVRFHNEQVFTCLDGVVAEIVRAAGQDSPFL